MDILNFLLKQDGIIIDMFDMKQVFTKNSIEMWIHDGLYFDAIQVNKCCDYSKHCNQKWIYKTPIFFPSGKN